MSAVYPPESSQDTAKGTLIQGYAMLDILNYNIVILTSKHYFTWNRGLVIPQCCSRTVVLCFCLNQTESVDKISVNRIPQNWTIKTL